MPRYMIGTDDPRVAVQMIALSAGIVAAQPPPAAVAPPAPQMPTPHPGLPPAVPSAAPPAPPTAPPAPPTAAPPLPPPAAVAPPPPAAAAPPPPAPAPASVAPEPDAQDQAVLAAGWTVEHMRATAQSYVKKHGNAGPGRIAEMCQKYIPGVAKPTVVKVPAKYWPQLHQELTA